MFGAIRLALTVLIFAGTLVASEVLGLVAKLASEKEAERGEALAALQQLGAAAEKELLAEEAGGKLNPQQLALVRRLVGDILVKRSPLKPIDMSKLKVFGEDKEKGDKGDPNLLFDRDSKIIVMKGDFVLEQGPLEYLIVSRGHEARLHETVIAVTSRPRDICYAMLACEYTYAGELGEDGKINLPKNAGVMLSLEFEWDGPHLGITGDPKTATEATKKTLVRVPIEYFAWNGQTEKTMKRVPFAFTGSRFEKHPETGKMYFMADLDKSVVAVRLDPNAIMNTPLDTRDIDPQHASGYGINRYVAQKRQTPVRVVMEPWSGETLTAGDLTDKGIDRGPAPKPTQAPNAAEEQK